jgi:hypothetical protein
MTYACPAWEFVADSRPLKFQRLQNGVPRTTGNLPRRTPTSVFQIPYVYDYITKICRKQAEVQTHENVNVQNIGRKRSPT